MPRTKKPAGATADARNGRRRELVAAGESRAPIINRSQYRPATLAMWDAYWTDAAATTQTPADVMWALVWIDAVDNFWKAKERADDEPLIEGSMGQQVLNPLYAVAKDNLAAAEKAAKQLGVGAKNRADLGVQLLAEQATLATVNEKYRAAAAAPAGGDDDDPRIVRAS